MPIAFNCKVNDIKKEVVGSLPKKLEEIIIEEKKSVGEIIIHVIEEREQLEINKEFLNHNYHTDVITFNSNFLNTISGEIFISYNYVYNYAQELNISFKHEFYRIVIHGILHLLGYNDKSASDKEMMTKKEDYYLNYINDK